ncbi:hypothetical protein GN278_00110 [Rhodobacteraceae bacterium Araon29]
MLIYRFPQITYLFLIALFAFFVGTAATHAANTILEPNKAPYNGCSNMLIDGATGSLENQTDQDQGSPNVISSGPKVLIKNINFIGNAALSDDELAALLNGCLGKKYDFQGLSELTNHVMSYYREKNYPFATAIFPPQTMSKGLLIIRIIEGKYGEVKTSGEASIANSAAAFLHKLKPGDIISEDLLNRTILILDEIPGIRVKPSIAAGEKQGLGNLDVLVSKEEPWSGSLKIDNHGEKSTGKNSMTLNLTANHLDTFGDSLSFSAIQADQNLTLVDLKYEHPIGFSGARLGINVATSQYHLGGDFSVFSGNVTKYKSTLSYPFVLTPKRKLKSYFSYNISKKHQFVGATLTDETFTSGFDLGMEFEQLYRSNNGRSTKSNLSLVVEDLKSTHNAQDSRKYKYLKGWIQHREPINDQLMASLELSFQNSVDQLSHSSNAYSLGGPNNIRAYSNDKISGPSGYHASFELSYNSLGSSSFVFGDFGEISAPSGQLHQALTGAGFGVRKKVKNLYTEVLFAFPLKSTETEESDPKLWLAIQSNF